MLAMELELEMERVMELEMELEKELEKEPEMELVKEQEMVMEQCHHLRSDTCLMDNTEKAHCNYSYTRHPFRYRQSKHLMSIIK